MSGSNGPAPQALAGRGDGFDVDELVATIEGPLLHDFQGTLGVIRLATQLLEGATQDPAAHASYEKILNACRRLSWRVEDLKAQLLVRLQPDRSLSADAGLDWAKVIETRLGELGRDHPRRRFSFEVSGQPRAALSAAHLLLVLHGLVDAAVRTTAATEDVRVKLSGGPPDGLVLSVSAERSTLPAGVLDQIELPPASWSLPDEGELPFRLVQAALLARKWRGDVLFFWVDGSVLSRATFPHDAG